MSHIGSKPPLTRKVFETILWRSFFAFTEGSGNRKHAPTPEILQKLLHDERLLIFSRDIITPAVVVSRIQIAIVDHAGRLIGMELN